MIGLMAWSADMTRMPYRIRSEHLSRFVLRCDLVEACYEAGGDPAPLRGAQAPIFAARTITDHAAPWRSVSEPQMPTGAGVTFMQSNGATTPASSVCLAIQTSVNKSQRVSRASPMSIHTLGRLPLSNGRILVAAPARKPLAAPPRRRRSKLFYHHGRQLSRSARGQSCR